MVQTLSETVVCDVAPVAWKIAYWFFISTFGVESEWQLITLMHQLHCALILVQSVSILPFSSYLSPHTVIQFLSFCCVWWRHSKAVNTLQHVPLRARNKLNCGRCDERCSRLMMTAATMRLRERSKDGCITECVKLKLSFSRLYYVQVSFLAKVSISGLLSKKNWMSWTWLDAATRPLSVFSLTQEQQGHFVPQNSLCYS